MLKLLLTLTAFLEVFVAPYEDYDYIYNGRPMKIIQQRSAEEQNLQFAADEATRVFDPHNYISPTIPKPTNQSKTKSGCAVPPASCPRTKYRSIDGSCNNVRNPTWGMPLTPYKRLLPAIYADGIHSLALAKSGKKLPLSRAVSHALFSNITNKDPKFTLATMQYGQIIAHDMTMILRSTQPPSSRRCCSPEGKLLEDVNTDKCYSVVFPANDPIALKSEIRCIDFTRTVTNRDKSCVGGNTPAEQLTSVNHFLDLSIVYGNTDEVHRQLREFQGGRLLTAKRNGHDWLPQHPNVTRTCPSVQTQTEPCYIAGDTRINQNPHLAITQTVLMREHNRLAKGLAQLNPHWNEETLFQEARRINIAQHQQITFYEWLPIFLGVQNLITNKIAYQTTDFVNDYNENVNPTMLNEYAAGAFRFFHSVIEGHLDLVSEARQGSGKLRLSDWFNKPVVVERGTNFDDLARGMVTQAGITSDQYVDPEVTQYLFRKRDKMFGQDLRALDLHRSRDHGLASYNDYRQQCGLPRARTFKDFTDVISKENVQRLSNIYESPDDVDLAVGGSIEKLVPGTLAGPVNLCLITEQFYRSRIGDRFFFENRNSETGFTLNQLNEIRKSSISRLLCDNGHNIKSMQPNGFHRITQYNPVMSCDMLPALDLSHWKESRVDLVAATPRKSIYDFLSSDDFLFPDD